MNQLQVLANDKTDSDHKVVFEARNFWGFLSQASKKSSVKKVQRSNYGYFAIKR